MLRRSVLDVPTGMCAFHSSLRPFYDNETKAIRAHPIHTPMDPNLSNRGFRAYSVRESPNNDTLFWGVMIDFVMRCFLNIYNKSRDTYIILYAWGCFIYVHLESHLQGELFGSEFAHNFNVFSLSLVFIWPSRLFGLLGDFLFWPNEELRWNCHDVRQSWRLPCPDVCLQGSTKPLFQQKRCSSSSNDIYIFFLDITTNVYCIHKH